MCNMLTEKDYCDYETCVALKELEYVGSSRYYYTQRDHKFHYDAYNKFYTVRTADAMGYVLAVHLYEAQKWLREEKKTGVFISGFIDGYTFWVYNLLSGDTLYQGFFNNETGKKYESYEEALSEGIKEAVKILKENETTHR